MRGPQADRAALEDILRYAGRARTHTAPGRASLDDDRTRDAVMYALAIVGEEANRVSAALQRAHSEVPWARIVSQRNILVHVYDRLDLDRVWDAVERLEDLQAKIEAIIEELPES